MLKHLLLFCLLGAFFLLFANAAPAPCQPASVLQEQIKQLDATATILYFAAHPDDENNQLIAHFAREKGFRTIYFSLTRGDGGQNLIGTEQGVDLGLLRTQELLAARAIDGGEQYFSRAYDFGFSKSAEETFQFWNREALLEDAVYLIRKTHPDIIICRFPADARAGHGQHIASAMIAKDAFFAAADPNRFPDQVRSLGTWKARRLLWNTMHFTTSEKTADDQYELECGNYLPAYGKSLGEIAAESRSQHKCQGFGVLPERGLRKEFFKHIAGDSAVSDILEGIQQKWSDDPKLKSLSESIRSAAQISGSDPASAVPILFTIRKQLAQLQQSPQRDTKIQQCEKLILACAGIQIEAKSGKDRFVANEKMPVAFSIINRSKLGFRLVQLASESLQVDLSLNKVWKKTLDLQTPNQLSQPYWLEQMPGQGSYQISRQSGVEAWNKPVQVVQSILLLGTDTLRVETAVKYLYANPAKGPIVEDLVVAPVLSANANASLLTFPTNKEKELRVFFQCQGSSSEKMRIHANWSNGNAWSIQPLDTVLVCNPDQPIQEIVYRIKPLNERGKVDALSFRVEAELAGEGILKSTRVIQYDHVPKITWFPDLKIQLRYMPMQLQPLKIAYIQGAGDKIPESLRQLGFQVDEFSSSAFVQLDLKPYSTIITGVRAFNVNKNMTQLHDKLMQFVYEGGTLLEQYNTNGPELNSDKMGPYKFLVGKNRVTDEKAEVNLMDAALPVLHYPNQISITDFDQWVQERGVYFTEEADSNYTRLFVLADPNEAEQSGSTLLANYGKGKFIYTGLSFFRQLPAGVPGATRLFVNLISNNQAPASHPASIYNERKKLSK